jgi:hypothetical protein
MHGLRILLLCLLVLPVVLTASPTRGLEEVVLTDAPIASTSLTISAEELRLSVLPNRTFDLVKLVPGKKAVSGSEVRVVPPGWSCDAKASAWECAGPEATQAHFSFGLDGEPKLGKIELELGYGGKRLSKSEITPIELERIEVIKSAASAIHLPSGVFPGDTFVATPSPWIQGGSWNFHVGSESYEPVDPATFGDSFGYDGSWPSDRLAFRMPDAVRDGAELRFTFDGPFGERWVDAVAPEFFFGDDEAEACEPELAECQLMTVVDGELCVCGCFPDLKFWLLTLDGKPIPIPSVASTSMVRFRLPEGTEPGTHVIAWPGKGESVEFEAVRAWGSVDQKKIQLGASAVLTFGLEGTKTPMPMQIELVQGAVSIAGGNEQIAWTSGPDNRFSRVLNTHGVGDFGIDYKFNALPCPCTNEPQESFFDDDFAIHPMAGEGSLDSVFLSGAKGRFPMTFSSDSIVARTPYPPFEPGADLEIEFVQLGLKGLTKGFGPFFFEERADQRSVGRFRDITLSDAGGFGSGAVDLELYTDFSTTFHKKLPLKVGATYDLGLENFELRGEIPGLGELILSERPEGQSSCRFENIKKDAAGKNLYGNATFRVQALAELKYDF